jgi:hypothetical protein
VNSIHAAFTELLQFHQNTGLSLCCCVVLQEPSLQKREFSEAELKGETCTLEYHHKVRVSAFQLSATAHSQWASLADSHQTYPPLSLKTWTIKSTKARRAGRVAYIWQRWKLYTKCQPENVRGTGDLRHVGTGHIIILRWISKKECARMRAE